jgi:hypothetical protein
LQYRGIVFVDSFLDDIRRLVFEEFVGREINAGLFVTRTNSMRSILKMNECAPTSMRS